MIISHSSVGDPMNRPTNSLRYFTITYNRVKPLILIYTSKC